MTVGNMSITVYCEEPSHNGVPYIVAQLGLTLYDAQDRRVYTAEENPVRRIWQQRPSLADEDGSTVKRLAGGEAASSSLVDDRHISAEEFEKNPTIFDGGSRHRYSFKCGKCGLALTSRGEKLDPVLNKLFDASFATVTIRGLAAIVS